MPSSMHATEESAIARSPHKSVQWDPAIIETGPIVERGSPSKRIVNTKSVEKEAGLDYEDMVGSALFHTLRSLNKLEKHERQCLMEALRNVVEDHNEENQPKKFLDMAKVGDIPVQNVSTLNPTDPEFELLRIGKPLTIDKKENIQRPSKQGANPTKLSEASVAASQPPQRKRVMYDDPREFGREVDAFESWYADKQLEMFVKKYPMTGKKAEDLPYKPQAAPKKRVGLSVLGGIAGAGVRHAAAIQHRLELLLYREKEKKAMQRRENSFKNQNETTD